jgi:hypothetical protein
VVTKAECFFLPSFQPLGCVHKMMQEAEDKEIDNNSRLRKDQHYANCCVASMDELLSVERGKQKTNCC